MLGRPTVRAAALAAAVTLTSAGCGGDDSSGSATGEPQGAYAGAQTAASGNAFQVVVLEDGSYWALYGSQVGSSIAVEGFIQVTGSASGSSFSSSNTRDFGTAPSSAGSLSASFVEGVSITGQAVTRGPRTIDFDGTTAAIAPYVYTQPAQLVNVVGDWNLQLLTGETAAVTVSNTGIVAGLSSLGCTFNGTISPRASGKNVFDVRVTFGASPCQLSGQTANGIGIFSPTNAGTQQIVVAVVESTRQYGFSGYGVR